MALIQCKEGVRIDRIQAGLAWIIFCLEEYGRLNERYLPDLLVITSIADGKHMETSRHYKGEALDLRTHNFPNRLAKREFRVKFERYLNYHPLLQYISAGAGVPNDNNRFRVLLENEGSQNEHFHIQVAKGKSFP